MELIEPTYIFYLCAQQIPILHKGIVDRGGEISVIKVANTIITSIIKPQ